MKFLCVPCDSPMKLETMAPPEGGSLSVVYSCPECGYEMAMLTNPFETQMVQSLGVRIGPETSAGASSVASASVGGPDSDARPSGDGEVGEGAPTSSAKCPFAAMIPAMAGAPQGAGQATSTSGGEPISVRWTSGAEARLANIPAFVRPMARTGIEKFAREQGSLEVDEKILDEARDFFGM
jgi:hypothetical protein